VSADTVSPRFGPLAALRVIRAITGDKRGAASKLAVCEAPIRANKAGLAWLDYKSIIRRLKVARKTIVDALAFVQACKAGPA
jgi:hypothetical protein